MTFKDKINSLEALIYKYESEIDNLNSNDYNKSDTKVLSRLIDILHNFFYEISSDNYAKDIYDTIKKTPHLIESRLVKGDDFNSIEDTYDEYVDGLEDYVKKVASNIDKYSNEEYEEDRTRLLDQLEAYSDRDKVFVNSLFNKNDKSYNMNSTMIEFEVLIEYYDDDIPDSIKDIEKIYIDINNDKEICDRVMVLMVSSYLSYYTNYTISYINLFKNTYKEIFNPVLNININKNNNDSFVLL